MREVWQTIRDELIRRASEGEDSVVLSEDTLETLQSFAQSGNAALASQKTKKDDVREIEFASELNVKIETPAAAESRKKVLVKIPADFKMAPIPAPTPFTLPDADKQTRWNALRDIVLNDPVCNAHIKPEKKVVFGVGNLDAKIFFCGEAPGADEEIQGEPFVGRAGQLLTKIIGAMGLSRNDVYIGNIMNWRPELPTPKGNRPPELFEMDYCLPYLKAQIEIVNPQVVVALGMTAVSGLLGYDQKRKMGKIRGIWGKFGQRDLMITYHPSFLLQYGSASTKRLVWEDMLAVMEKVELPISEKQRNYFKS